jgi:hypothetical protein
MVFARAERNSGYSIMFNDSGKSDLSSNDENRHGDPKANRELFFVTGDRLSGRRMRNTFPTSLPASSEKLPSDIAEQKNEDDVAK